MTENSKLPTIDLSQYSGTPSEKDAFLSRLRAALYDHGFFYLVGHGISDALAQDVLSLSRKFFALPEQDKLEIEMVKTPRFRGYNRVGFELTQGKQDWREQVDFDTERDEVDVARTDPAWMRVLGPNQWPRAMPELRPAILEYQSHTTRIGRTLLRAISEALGQKADVLDPLFQPHPAQHLKILRYPGQEGAQSSQGVGAHKDGGLITILLNDQNGGLRVQDESGIWHDAPPRPGAIIVNTGELLELITDGFVKADIHAVVAPPPGIDRYSVAFFLGAFYGAELPVLTLPQEMRGKQRGLTTDPLNPILRTVGENHLKARLRSHPDVAQAHYGDLA